MQEVGSPGRSRYKPSPEEIASGLCECGCGKSTNIAKATYRAKRHFIGYPVPRLPGHLKGIVGTGADHPRWKGGRVRTAAGYIVCRAPDHPDADTKGYVWEHRLVAEQMLGRRILPEEDVHHINFVRDDNRPENLAVLSKSEHAAIHGPRRKFDSDKMRQAGLKGAAARWGKKP